jgi:hypothetical protein
MGGFEMFRSRPKMLRMFNAIRCLAKKSASLSVDSDLLLAASLRVRSGLAELRLLLRRSSKIPSKTASPQKTQRRRAIFENLR